MTDHLEDALNMIGDTSHTSEKARLILPALVRQSYTRQTITYKDLAGEVNTHHRQIPTALGKIGHALEHVELAWGESIPPLQCLVVSKKTKGIGNGIGWVYEDREEFEKLSKVKQEVILNGIHKTIFEYKKWDSVLEALQLPTAASTTPGPFSSTHTPRGSGESKEHKRLKAQILQDPRLVNVPVSYHGELEHALPSGDRVDVFFRGRGWHIGVEVKPSFSDEADITRGLYQCVKYRAVLEARQAVQGEQPKVRVILALAQALPTGLISLKNALGIEVITVTDESSTQ